MNYGKRALWVLAPVVVLLASIHGQTFGPWTRDKESRQNQARQWRDGFVRLNAEIPTLSPEEQRWLKTEVDDTIAAAGGTYTTRALAAMDSKEYQVSVSKVHVQRIIAVINQILSAGTARNERAEFSQWLRLASLFLDKTFWQAINGLVERKIVSSKINGLTGLYYENHVLWAQQIIDGLIVGYFESRSLP
jgi:hypothetical protein